jgi:hypothetical protein
MSCRERPRNNIMLKGAASYYSFARSRCDEECASLFQDHKRPLLSTSSLVAAVPHEGLSSFCLQVPLDTNAFVTMWIPLRAMDEDDSGLLFATGMSRLNCKAVPPCTSFIIVLVLCDCFTCQRQSFELQGSAQIGCKGHTDSRRAVNA